jgi:DNA helicase MCM8
LFETYKDDVGDVDIRRSQFGTGMSRSSDVKRFVAKLRELYQRSYNDLFGYNQLYQVAQDLGIRFTNFEDFLDLVRFR